MIIVLYVDDLLMTGSSKDAMNHAFSMTNLGLLSQFLGLKISQTKQRIVRKIGPQSNNRYTVKSMNKMQKHIKHYRETHI